MRRREMLGRCRYEKATIRNVVVALQHADIIGRAFPPNFSVRRVAGDIVIDLPRGMRHSSMRRFIRDNVLLPTFGKRAAGGMKFERHSWWDN